MGRDLKVTSKVMAGMVLASLVAAPAMSPMAWAASDVIETQEMSSQDAASENTAYTTDGSSQNQ